MFMFTFGQSEQGRSLRSKLMRQVRQTRLSTHRS